MTEETHVIKKARRDVKGGIMMRSCLGWWSTAIFLVAAIFLNFSALRVAFDIPSGSTTQSDGVGDAPVMAYTKERVVKESDLPNNTKKQRPIAVIHIGPRKTGTTTIQELLVNLVTRKYLQADSYVFLGKDLSNPSSNPDVRNYFQIRRHFLDKIVFRNNGKSLRQWAQEPAESKIWHDLFVGDLQQRRANGTNVVLSEEGLTFLLSKNNYTDNLLAFKEAFDGFEIHVVATYRRYYDWIPSSWSEENKFSYTRVTKSFSEWYNEQKDPKKKSMVSVPLDGNLISKWRDIFAPDYFHVIHMQNSTMEEPDERGFAERFICDMLPGAVQTCAAAKNKSIPVEQATTNMGTGLALRPVLLTRAATEAGFWNINPQNGKAIEAKTYVHGQFRSFKSKHNDPPPVICAGQEAEDEILKDSIAIEKEVFPDREISIDGITKGFQRAAHEKRKFCCIDYLALFERPEWKAFLKETSITLKTKHPSAFKGVKKGKAVLK